jgi:hypothetical protein
VLKGDVLAAIANPAPARRSGGSRRSARGLPGRMMRRAKSA